MALFFQGVLQMKQTLLCKRRRNNPRRKNLPLRFLLINPVFTYTAISMSGTQILAYAEKIFAEFNKSSDDLSVQPTLGEDQNG